jgi:hypothetical protein
MCFIRWIKIIKYINGNWKKKLLNLKRKILKYVIEIKINIILDNKLRSLKFKIKLIEINWGIKK